MSYSDNDNSEFRIFFHICTHMAFTCFENIVGYLMFFVSEASNQTYIITSLDHQAEGQNNIFYFEFSLHEIEKT